MSSCRATNAKATQTPQTPGTIILTTSDCNGLR